MGGSALNSTVTGETKTGRGVSSQLIQFDLLATADTITIEAGLDAFYGTIDTLEIMFNLVAQLIGSIPCQVAAISRWADSPEVRVQLRAQLIQRATQVVKIGSVHGCACQHCF
ncbi:hypothetical protein GCM10011352_30830 [Marinobacterium zhoushanense]|uniref:Uncharacterized protein n=1 Tax=Marinobacterium zhoushanense TaxID=1679163 RepID=A0ABQ1KP27_9GAMM|nr:hypothetical protein GCM10011352_30830 [Marinobacterium zhoushanense]